MLFRFFVVSLLFSNFIYAAENQSSVDYSIPYFQYRYEEIDLSKNPKLQSHVQSSYGNVPRVIKKEIKQLLKPNEVKEIAFIGETFCRDLGDSDLKLWFTLGANGSIGIAGMSSEAGIEVTFHCKRNQ